MEPKRPRRLYRWSHVKYSLALAFLWMHPLPKPRALHLATPDTVAHRTSVAPTRATVPNSMAYLANGTKNDTIMASLHVRRILLVHVGKTGGETIKSILTVGCHSMRNKNRRRRCLDQLPTSQLSRVVQGYRHCGFEYPSATQRARPWYDAHLYSVRHPVDRILSWFHYVNPSSCLVDPTTSISPSCTAARIVSSDPTSLVAQWWSCCATVPEWARALSTNESTPCRTLARDVTAGQVDRTRQASTWAHAGANYHYYRTTTTAANSQNATILVVRMTHVWHDLVTLDRLLNGTGDFGTKHGTAYTHGSEVYRPAHDVDDATSSTISILCCALYSELVVYRSLIEAAVNLSPMEKETTVRDTVQRCGWATWSTMATDCSTADATSANMLPVYF